MAVVCAALAAGVIGVGARLGAASAPATCSNLNMVWRDAANAVVRSDAYTCGNDLCAGYRCVVGNEISPACYNAAECPSACAGTCVDIPSAQLDCAALCSGSPSAPLTAATPEPTPNVPTTFGTLSNFDVFNTTGEDCHGFEIELHGVSSQDVLYTFGSTYQRYGDPTVEDFPGGVYVRYKSAYDSATGTFVQTTPKAPAVISPTDGHACWTGGAGNYLTSGCEHFGLQLQGNATKTIYRWLVADPGNPSALRASGSVVSIPAPIWNVQAPPPDAPNPVNPVVGAVMEPEPPRDRDYGDAMWVKVFKTEAPEPADLDHLLSDDPAVPDDPTETETEWKLLQPSRKKPNKLENEAQIGDGNESVTRRYEFYEYTGAYDPENHEAQPVDDTAPLESEIGNYIGAQMVAINLGQGPLPVPCAGDCNDDGAVTIDDIVLAVNVVLGVGPVDSCATVDTDGDGTATIDELIAAVNHALGGC